MAFNKQLAVFVVFLVFTTALHRHVAEAAAEPVTDEKFKSCFTDCVGECLASGRGYSTCEMGCDNDCTTKEIWDKVTELEKGIGH